MPISAPVHAFRFSFRRIGNARLPAQFAANFVCAPMPSITFAFPLACVGHLIAVSTREVFPGLIKLSYASTAAISWTQKPMPDAAIVAISGLQFDGIIEALPFVGVVITEVIAQETPVKTRNSLQSSRPEFSR